MAMLKRKSQPAPKMQPVIADNEWFDRLHALQPAGCRMPSAPRLNAYINKRYSEGATPEQVNSELTIERF